MCNADNCQNLPWNSSKKLMFLFWDPKTYFLVPNDIAFFRVWTFRENFLILSPTKVTGSIDYLCIWLVTNNITQRIESLCLSIEADTWAQLTRFCRRNIFRLSWICRNQFCSTSKILHQHRARCSNLHPHSNTHTTKKRIQPASPSLMVQSI